MVRQAVVQLSYPDGINGGWKFCFFASSCKDGTVHSEAIFTAECKLLTELLYLLMSRWYIGGIAAVDGRKAQEFLDNIQKYDNPVSIFDWIRIVYRILREYDD